MIRVEFLVPQTGRDKAASGVMRRDLLVISRESPGASRCNTCIITHVINIQHIYLGPKVITDKQHLARVHVAT